MVSESPWGEAWPRCAHLQQEDGRKGSPGDTPPREGTSSFPLEHKEAHSNSVVLPKGKRLCQRVFNIFGLQTILRILGKLGTHPTVSIELQAVHRLPEAHLWAPSEEAWETF